MAGMTITLQVETAALLRDLGEAARRGRNLRPAWEEVGDILLQSVAENFRVGGRPDPWPPLKDTAIAKSRRRRGTGISHGRRARGKILDASGRLARSIKKHLIPDGVEVGSELVYAAAHQFGTDDLPARPFLAIQPEDEQAISAVISRYLTEPFK